jgi:hypothetical protein
MKLDRKHKPNDPCNCLCDECVYASLARMGGPLEARKITKKEWLRREETDGRVSNS